MNTVVGTKQVKKALKEGTVKEVFIAENTDIGLKNKLVALCEKYEVKISYMDTKKELGENFGIGINAAIAAILI
ncbi:Ribosomal protein L7Ae/L30e/S12e/Gadd45 [Peptoniphilus sp. ING2-D1G]|nr:Ribosomal protein L7Ae/L30e/S12e/Gadd45 [Peptoniphilus sp. ING2-D1G]